ARVGRAVVVADPTESLPDARREGEDAAAAYRAARDAQLVAGADATRARVLAAIDGAGLLHFAGHGTYAGVDGWDSALRLARGDRLAVGDVLALPHAPAVVVLSGCETGR